MAVRRRLADTARFYALLAHIEEKVGGRRRLAECDGGMDWPSSPWKNQRLEVS